jgi:uncharacterized membrane protein YbhN (UPF0104 family)
VIAAGRAAPADLHAGDSASVAAVRRRGPSASPYSTLVGLLGYYCLTWIIGGAAIFFLMRSLGASPSVADIPYLGGVAAVSAIVAFLSLITPSGLGVREASMYGLLLAITTKGVALV